MQYPYFEDIIDMREALPASEYKRIVDYALADYYGAANMESEKAKETANAFRQGTLRVFGIRTDSPLYHLLDAWYGKGEDPDFKDDVGEHIAWPLYDDLLEHDDSYDWFLYVSGYGCGYCGEDLLGLYGCQDVMHEEERFDELGNIFNQYADAIISGTGLDFVETYKVRGVETSVPMDKYTAQKQTLRYTLKCLSDSVRNIGCPNEKEQKALMYKLATSLPDEVILPVTGAMPSYSRDFYEAHKDAFYGALDAVEFEVWSAMEDFFAMPLSYDQFDAARQYIEDNCPNVDDFAIHRDVWEKYKDDLLEEIDDAESDD